MEKKKNFDIGPQLYDLQVNWPARFAKEKSFFENIISVRNIKKILDIGCGTGRHVQLFSEIITKSDKKEDGSPKGDAKEGAKENGSPHLHHLGDAYIVGIDPAEETIKYARDNVVTAKNIKLIVGGFENLENLVAGQFELITCLGNTLALLGNRHKVKIALKTVRKKLVKGGLALFQFLNFEPKMIEKERFYKPKTFNKDGFKYITLKHFEYGKIKTLADFIQIQIDDSGSITDFLTHTSYMCTLRKNIFLKMAHNAGFKKIELLSPSGGQEFDKNKHISLIALLYN